MPIAIPAEARSLIERLSEITRDWNAHDPVPKRQKDEVREIGNKINSLGGGDPDAGFELMQAAYYAVKAKNRHAATVQAYWDGIGNWRW